MCEVTCRGSCKTAGQASMRSSNSSEELSEHALDEQLGVCCVARCCRLSTLKQQLHSIKYTAVGFQSLSIAHISNSI